MNNSKNNGMIFLKMLLDLMEGANNDNTNTTNQRESTRTSASTTYQHNSYSDTRGTSSSSIVDIARYGDSSLTTGEQESPSNYTGRNNAESRSTAIKKTSRIVGEGCAKLDRLSAATQTQFKHIIDIHSPYLFKEASEIQEQAKKLEAIKTYSKLSTTPKERLEILIKNYNKVSNQKQKDEFLCKINSLVKTQSFDIQTLNTIHKLNANHNKQDKGQDNEK